VHDRGSDAYFSAGQQALEVCKGILAGSQPRRVIDFGCGYGRALRWFRAEWPRAEIFAVDIDPEALRFVSTTFGAIPVAGDHHLKMSIPGNIDLIFSGSLLTHLDQWQWDIFLPMCVDALAADGTLVATIHGRIAALLASQNHPVYGNAVDVLALHEAYKANSFAFLPYSKDYPTFGLTLSSPEWVMRQLQKIGDAKIVAFHEAAWGQDVIALRKNPWSLLP
jgi:SAM-dependent methyltransferase